MTERGVSYRGYTQRGEEITRNDGRDGGGLSIIVTLSFPIHMDGGRETYMDLGFSPY